MAFTRPGLPVLADKLHSLYVHSVIVRILAAILSDRCFFDEQNCDTVLIMIEATSALIRYLQSILKLLNHAE